MDKWNDEDHPVTHKDLKDFATREDIQRELKELTKTIYTSVFGSALAMIGLIVMLVSVILGFYNASQSAKFDLVNERILTLQNQMKLQGEAIAKQGETITEIKGELKQINAALHINGGNRRVSSAD